MTTRPTASGVATLLVLVLSGPAGARGVELPRLGSANARTLVVDIRHGADGNPGTGSRPLRTVTAAWNKIAARSSLSRPVHILVRPGRYPAAALPNYWESRWGTASAPIVISAARAHTVSFASVNLFDLRWLAFERIDFHDRFDLWHCERCSHVLLDHARLTGSPADLHENIKVNQSSDIGITHTSVSGADDNAIDFVAVRYGLISDDDISHAHDWCAYAKGGSAFVTVTRNHIHDCGTGGFTAGQGTGLQFMTAPFIRYEAYGISVTGNIISRTAGAAVGINGGFGVFVASNRIYDVGARSHEIEVTYGLRSCDGRPGDKGRQACQANLDRGAWGTTRVDDGTNAVRIPNRHVVIAGNVIDNPRRQGDQLFNIAGPYDGPAQHGSGLGAVRTDDDLRIFGNVIAGRGLPTGAESCRADDCRHLAARNTLDARPGLFADPGHGDFALASGRAMPAVRRPHFDYAEAGVPGP